MGTDVHLAVSILPATARPLGWGRLSIMLALKLLANISPEAIREMMRPSTSPEKNSQSPATTAPEAKVGG